MAKISVIVPVYKVEPYLRRCVDSILEQSFKDFELILVDDGSPDRCGEICEECAKGDGRIHVIHRTNGGLPAARNSGLEWMKAHSQSEWVMFVDSDDWIGKYMLESLYRAAVSNSVLVAVTGFKRYSKMEQVATELKNEMPYEVLLADVFVERCFNLADCRRWVNDTAWGKLYHRKLFDTLRFPENRRVHEDTFTTYKAIFKANMVAFTRSPYYAYYANPDSIMRVTWNPGWLNVLDGQREQMEYFARTGNKRALKSTFILHAERSVELYYMVVARADGKIQAIRIRKGLRDAFKRWGVGDADRRHCLSAYQLAFPVRGFVRKFYIDLCDYGIVGLVKKIYLKVKTRAKISTSHC